MKKFLQLVLITSLLYVVFLPAQASGQFFFFLEENALVGKEVPEIELPLIGGETNKLSELIHNQNAIIYFWARWCPPCRDHLKELEEIQAVFKEKNIKFVLVGLGETADSAEKFLAKFKINLPNFADVEEITMESFDIRGLPTFFYVDAKGMVVAVEHELLENYEEILNQNLEKKE